MSIYTHTATVHDSIDGKPVTVKVNIEINLDRLVRDVSYHVVRGRRGVVTRARGAIVARRVRQS